MRNRVRNWVMRGRAGPGTNSHVYRGLSPWAAAVAVCLIACGAAFLVPSSAFAQKGESDLGDLIKIPKMDSSTSNDPMLLQADEMIYDNENNRVTAKGNVEIYYNNYTLLADQVIYDRGANTLAAAGNVRIKDPDGAIITSNQMTLTDDFRDGFIDALRVVTKDDTRIVAQTASREAGNVTVFSDGWFTPCKPCERNPSKPPTWRLRAKKIIHRKDAATITYKNAFLDAFGVPIVWVPWFQSADPTVKRKSGFLMPNFTQSDRLGSAFTVPYYFALADNYDFTFAPMFTTEAGVLLQGSWRHRLASGAYRVDLAGVVDEGTFDTPADSDFRGSIDTAGKFALNPYWSWGWKGEAQTDDTFRRFYHLDSDIKTDRISQLYMEGLHDRNYASMRFYDTGTLLTTKNPLADAVVYPIIDYDFIVDNPVVGGELSFNSNLMALANADGTDSNRAVVEMQWRRQFIDGLGQVFTPFGRLRGDAYAINEFVDPDSGLEVSDGGIFRGNAVAGAEYRYPFIGTTGSVVHVIEPVAQIIARPNDIGDQEEIPNEDAQSLVFDDTILFDIDKFSGYDRVETGTRANVGLRYTAQLPSGAYARAVVGESYQLAGENPFGENTGLGTKESDYVAGLYLEATRYLSFVGQTRFDKDTLELRRTNLGSSGAIGPFSFLVNYAQVDPKELIADDPFRQRRQEILTKGGINLTDTWGLLGGLRYDLDLQEPITQGLGLRYRDDCLTATVFYEQSEIQDRDIEPEKRVMLTLSLKYLGTYEIQTDANDLLGPDETSGIGTTGGISN
jgi:LPS-assembly protein